MKENPAVVVNQRRSSIQSIKRIINLLKSTSPLRSIIGTDISGIGAVLAHRMTDGSEKPIGFISNTLTPAEKNYSRLEKEGLPRVFEIKSFIRAFLDTHFQYIQITYPRNHCSVRNKQYLFKYWEGS